MSKNYQNQPPQRPTPPDIATPPVVRIEESAKPPK